MSPVVKDIDETGAQPMTADIGALVDAPALDAEQRARRVKHPFEAYCENVLSAVEIPVTQAAREVVSAVCGDVARLAVVTEAGVKDQAEHIGKLIAKEREEMGDRQLWKETATKIAEHALRLRIEDKGVVADMPAAA